MLDKKTIEVLEKINNKNNKMIEELINTLTLTDIDHLHNILYNILTSHGIAIPYRWIPLFYIVRKASENNNELIMEIDIIIRDYDIKIAVKINKEELIPYKKQWNVRDYYIEVQNTRNNKWRQKIIDWDD